MVSIVKVDTLQNTNSSNLITQANATTITIGASGQTVSVPSGSTLQVNTIQNTNSSALITQTNATTITLGTTGQTIAVASGATLLGAGLSWQSVQSTGFTAVKGNAYPCNTTSAAFTVTLPASASTGDQIALVDYAGTFATNYLTLNPNGLKINGETLNKLIVSKREGVILTYIDSTQGWVVTTAANDGTLALAGTPGVPTIGTATATGPFSATVSFTAPSDNGGFTITSYTATSSPGGITGTLSQSGSGTITVTGLSEQTSYTFTVTATNAIGTSAASAASNSITTPASSYTAEFLVVAGGGGNQVEQGGNRESGSGAGGLRTSYGSTSGGGAAAESDLTFTAGTVYTITVGAGASGQGQGGSSEISGSGITTITSSGGGRGANNDGEGGGSGGCGGGGWYTGGPGSGTANQGYNGGTGYTGSPYGGTGGGAAGAGGRDTAVGPGLAVAITGSSVTYSTGGVSNNFPSTTRNTNGAPNTGDGAGGAANGGSGVVIIRIPTVNYTGTTSGSPTVTTDGSSTILKYTGSGSYTA